MNGIIFEILSVLFTRASALSRLDVYYVLWIRGYIIEA